MATNEETKKLTNMLVAFEGTKKTSYVPTRTVTRNGKKVKEVIGRSGVTIGKGLDLGAQNKASINALGLSDALANKLKNSSYLGKKGQAALDAHTAALSLTAEEEKELNEKLVSKYADDFTLDYIEKVGRDPAELTENQRLALTSAYFNLGRGLFGPQLTQQLKDKDYSAAAKNLMNWHSESDANKGLNNRRGAEAFLFSNYIGAEDVGQTRDMFNKNQDALTKYRATDFNTQSTTDQEAAAQARAEFAQTDPRRVDLPTPTPTPEPVPYTPIRNYAAENIVNSNNQRMIQPIRPLERNYQYQTMEDLIGDKDLLNPLVGRF